MRTLRFHWSLSILVTAAGCGVGGDGMEGSGASAGTVDDQRQAITGRICPGGTTVEGIDVSFYQGSVDWSAVKASGRAFGIARVSDGLNYPDSQFDANWPAMKAAGLIRGAYQFFEPGQDAIAQANMVITKVGQLGAGDLPVMLDMEATNGLSAAAITSKVHQWVDAVTAGTGKKPMIYTGAYFWDDNVKTADFAGLPLVIAWYGTNCPGLPNAWTGWTMHQYTSSASVPGISGNVDADVFNGSLPQLQALAGAQADAPSTPYQTLAADLNGDGKDDLVTVSASAKGAWSNWFAVELSSGNGFTSTVWESTTPQHMRNGGSNSDFRVVKGDFNGDGRADVATISPNALGAWSSWLAMDLSTGAGFTSTTWGAATPQHMRNGGSGQRYQVLTGDFNGDGLIDVATISPNGLGAWSDWVAMELSTGSGFASTTWGAATPQHMRNGGADRAYFSFAIDLNGDGLTDIVTVSPNGLGAWSSWFAVELSTGSGFTSTTWESTTPQHMRNGSSSSSYRVVTGDFNGDGKMDLATVSPNGQGAWLSWFAMDLSTGSGFTSTTWESTTPQHMRNGDSNSHYDVFTGDFNGDGLTDVATISPNGLGAWSSWLAMDLSTGTAWTSTVWGAATPQHMRNGGSGNTYTVLPGHFAGSKYTDVLTISPNGLGAWQSWSALEISSGSAFTSATWDSTTTQHMRNGY